MNTMIEDSLPKRFNKASYFYHLPKELIAQEPVLERTQSRLMVLNKKKGVEAHLLFADLVSLMRKGDCLVINDTKVIPARLFGIKPTLGKVEVLVTTIEHNKALAMVSPKRGIREGLEVVILDKDGNTTDERIYFCNVRKDGYVEVELRGHGCFKEVLHEYGRVPLPPYIKRENEMEIDKERYQTVYAKEDGAVAAPTAGLHFTQQMLEILKSKGVVVTPITLHVGPGTFKPIRVEDIRKHVVDSEEFIIQEKSAEEVNKALAEKRRIVAVGTTVVRCLETVVGQEGKLKPMRGRTDLIIYPGFRFKVVSAMVTNFHLPCSSLLLLVCAFAGRKRILDAYKEAVMRGYRFYSYGDAMFIY